MKHMGLQLLRSALVAVVLLYVLLFLSDYFGWHLWNEAGGITRSLS
jgi:hypothetical protein